MTDGLSTYKKFIYKDDALDLIKVLENHHIVYELKDNSSRLGSSFGGDINTNEFELKIQKEDFEKVENLEEELVKNDIENVSKDYYLFDFSDEELIEIVMKKEEWNKFDFLLAQKILKERGKEIPPSLLNVIKKQRIKDLSSQEESPKWLIYIGYFLAFVGGYLGIIIGIYLTTYQKVLPNGEKIYAYSDEDRKRGKTILYCSIISSIFWTVLRFFR
ncbi:hypothetical protein ACM39_01150 [Chryseobacterium sp. FH2]|uniref:hypothetical protein n=1 Tax=Chryseobacterium sp. FH2 TaxID=1674291 RepID=UPI00065A9745|nr:hypothetical protein [Chryseobacterium sp. FH2]KMQ69693.1 hypothetical protein ACM39_01150 [Chryseobacterium sp. FH2]